MNYTGIVLAIVGFAAAVGAAAVFFKRGAGLQTISLLQTNIDAYKDSEIIKDKQIAYLKGQLDIKDKVIERLVNNDKRRKRSSQ